MTDSPDAENSKTLYIIFDKLPQKDGGGLTAAYITLIKELSPLFSVTLVGIFGEKKTNVPEFSGIPLHVISRRNIDNRFFNALTYLKKGLIKKFVFAFWSGLYYFASRPILKMKSRKLLKNQIVIASSPAAAMFLSKKIKYILEIHTSFDYFWGKNFLGRMQSALIPSPAITVFRNKHDAEKGNKFFPSTFVYNAFNSDSIPKVDFHKPLTHSAIFVGRLAPEKNPLRLLECAQLTKQSIPNFTLDIYGDGPLFNTLQERIIQMELQNTVYLKGFVDNKAIYQNYDLLWVTSNFEGFGLVIIEAMANGIPCVSTNWGEAVSEIIQNKKTGYIANSNEEFVNFSTYLLTNQDVHNIFSQNAFIAFQHKFTLAEYGDRWKKLLQKIYSE